MSRSYIRDKRSPAPKSEAVSRVMSANRARDTKPELLLRKALYHAGHRGYRINYRIRLNKDSPPSKGGVAEGRGGGSVIPRSPIPNPQSSVRPDITFVGKKLAIFVHGCYWHRSSSSHRDA